MSAKQTKIKIDWQLDAEAEIPLNSRLSKDSSEVYPFAFVSSEEFYLGKEIE